MGPTRGYLHADGARLEYRWFGGGPSDRAIVLLHDGLGCITTWRDFPDRLARETGWPVFAYSRLGYGGSDPVDLPRPWIYMHHEGEVVLPQVLAGAGIEDAVLVGHSDGGSIAIVHAALEGRGEASHTPPRVRSLILIAAHVFNEPLSRRTIEAVGRRYRSSELRERLERHHGANVDGAFLGWHDAWLAPEFESWNLEEYLPSISLPSLVLQGLDDRFGTRAQVDAIIAGLGGPTACVMIDDCGHSPHRERPEVVIETIARFLA